MEQVKKIAVILALLSFTVMCSAGAYAAIELRGTFRQATQTMAQSERTLKQLEETATEAKETVKDFRATIKEANETVAAAHTLVATANQELMPLVLQTVKDAKQDLYELSYLMNDNLLYARGTMTNIQETSAVTKAASEEQRIYWGETNRQLAGLMTDLRARVNDPEISQLLAHTDELLVKMTELGEVAKVELAKTTRTGRFALIVNALAAVAGVAVK